MITQRDLALVALTTRAVASEVQPLSSREVHTLPGLADPETLLGREPQDLATQLRVEASVAVRLHSLLSRAPQAAQVLEGWEHQGIWVLTDRSADYPDSLRARLGDQAPVVLHGVGEASLLSEGGLGVVGSRNLSQSAETLARQLGSYSASHGMTLVSGGARGADRLAGQNALVEGGLSVWVLADAMRRVAAEPALRASILADRLTLCSPYHPDASFTAGAAMGRNKLIYAIADRTVVVASDLDKGGTWSGAKEALKNRYGQVLVWRGDGEGPGNAALEALGALPFSTFSDLTAVPQRESVPPQPTDAVPDNPEQLTLEL
jgi:predicted Rossmann fold nucleotide-binding protein DprA/Smf involved in DNA uptake